MDGPRFDALTQQLASIRLSRQRAVRGLMGGVAALTGAAAFTGDVEARKKRPYCACADATATCTDESAGKKARKRYLKDHPCSYPKACRGSGSHNPCQGAGTQTTVNRTVINRMGDVCVTDNDCGGRSSGLECVGLICLPIVGAAIGDTCVLDADCATGRCQGGVCVACPGVDLCGPDTNAQCCVANADCVRDVCVLPTSSL